MPEPSPLSSLEQRLLDAVERHESALLGWGISHFAHRVDELHDLLDDPPPSDKLRSTIEALAERQLLIEASPGDRSRVRSRMAETVRLIERLRQILKADQQQTAPSLVSGFRFARLPRLIPDRSIDAAQALDELGDLAPDDSKTAQVLRAMLGSRKISGFQLRSTRAILKAHASERDRGVVITAGTGSGKTLAFYLPAFMRLADRVDQPAAAPSVIAVYPRNELLKDQFSAAIAEIERCSELWKKLGRRPRVGVLYGAVPHALGIVAAGKRHAIRAWPKHPEGLVCPHLTSPNGRRMILLNEDIAEGRERLVEETPADHSESQSPSQSHAQPRYELGPEAIALTRESMLRNPPDILFISLEMVNRILLDTKMRRLIIGPSGGQRLILLDEIHLYEGNTGAQSALLLRRWRHAMRSTPAIAWVGLSATLPEPTRVLADLTGVSQTGITHIAPHDHELSDIGVRYALILRGDPFSRSALLATTIQTAMLTARMIGPLGTDPSRGVHPGRALVFTDDLDVTHRLITNIADAERGGLARFTHQGRRAPLAALRSRELLAHHAEPLHDEGQFWHACERLGHNLLQPMTTDEVSSRSRGINPRAGIVVATSTLEVGIDDEQVGAVIQHRAPRSSSGFLQRIGRAGRNTAARPWSITVLSDHGRDRAAYQAYEQIFHPHPIRRDLPIRNRYILGMQAGFATIEFLARAAHKHTRRPVNAWNLFAPDTNRIHERVRAHIRKTIEAIIESDSTERQSLRNHISNALGGLSDQLVDALCWDEPRPIIAQLLPTAWRRLAPGINPSNTPLPGEPAGNCPLPDFLPNNLFSSLNLPEVRFDLPSERAETEPIVRALRNFAPGRVNKRYARNEHESHWLWPAGDEWIQRLLSNDRDIAVDLRPLCTHDQPIGRFAYHERDPHGNAAEHTAVCIRPTRLRLTTPPRAITDRTNSQLLWRAQIDSEARGEPHHLPPIRDGWSPIREIAFQTHAESMPATVRRFATGATIAVAARSGLTPINHTTNAHFRYADEPAALGFAIQADAIRVTCPMPIDLTRRYSTSEPNLQRGTRYAFLRDAWLSDPLLPDSINFFDRSRLFTVALAAAVRHAIERNTPLGECIAETTRSAQHFADECSHAAERIFGSAPGHERGQAELRRVASHPLAAQRFANLIELIEQPPHAARPDQFRRWLEHRYAATLAAAAYTVTMSLCPDADESEAAVDIEPGPPIFDHNAHATNNDFSFWISETNPGGAGFVQRFAEIFAEGPRRVARSIDAALGPSPWEIVDAEMRRLIGMHQAHPELREYTAAYRNARGYHELETATRQLLHALQRQGIRLTSAVRSTIFSRWLRPGSGEATDTLLNELLQLIDRTEASIDLEVDPTIIAHLAANSHHLRPVFDRLPGAIDDPAWRQQQAYSLLWPRGVELRERELQPPAPFATPPRPDRLIVLATAPSLTTIDALATDAIQQATRTLRAHAVAHLHAPPHASAQLAERITTLTAARIDFGRLTLHPHLAALIEHPGQLVARFELPVAAQGARP